MSYFEGFLICNILFSNMRPNSRWNNSHQDDLQNKRRSFFLGVGFHKPHVPFHIPHQYLDLHNLGKFNEPVNTNRTENLPNIAWNPWMDLKKREDIKVPYYL